jgi:hypothetical protein
VVPERLQIAQHEEGRGDIGRTAPRAGHVPSNSNIDADGEVGIGWPSAAIEIATVASWIGEAEGRTLKAASVDEA